MMKLHECLDELKDRVASGNGDHVPLLTKDVIDLIEERNALYGALEAVVDECEYSMSSCLYGDALTALAKARGEA